MCFRNLFRMPALIQGITAPPMLGQLREWRHNSPPRRHWLVQNSLLRTDKCHHRMTEWRHVDELGKASETAERRQDVDWPVKSPRPSLKGKTTASLWSCALIVTKHATCRVIMLRMVTSNVYRVTGPFLNNFSMSCESISVPTITPVGVTYTG